MTRIDPVRILAISGSLRRGSSNGALISAAAGLAPACVEISIFETLAELPPFNPDCDQTGPPDPVAAFRSRLDACDAVLISSPEYAHGVPGVLKNALDWVVGSGELIGKPIALVNTSSRATHAWASLLETLTTMSARVIPEASITIPLRSGTNAAAILADSDCAKLVRSALASLATATHRGRVG